jgi:hypothetical protein
MPSIAPKSEDCRRAVRRRVAGRRTKTRVRFADAAHKIAKIGSVASPDRIDRDVLHRQTAGLDVEIHYAVEVDGD